MHPAPSVILFTVLSGLGFGFLALLGLDIVQSYGVQAFALWALGYGLAVGGLLASTFHLGHPERAWRAFSQWKSSWLSREGIAAVATLLILAPAALSDCFELGFSPLFGRLGAVLAMVTIGTTSMIYAQLKSIPRWNHWSTPLHFFGFALAGAALMAGKIWAVPLLLLLATAMIAHWHFGDRRFAEVGASMETATGLGSLGTVSVFDPAHTAGNYLLREMIYVVARKHVAKLRGLALLMASALPAVALLLLPAHPVVIAGAVLCHLVGAAAARWLFFAQAEHVVGLYYGKR
jgi:sulfite dehydrogenase (quinone) subunit SoeC